jgi:hypothetical protein
MCFKYRSPLMLWVRIPIRARCTTLCDKVCQWLATGKWFSPGLPVSSTNKTYHHDITEILLKVALNTIKQTNKQTNIFMYKCTFDFCFNSKLNLFSESCFIYICLLTVLKRYLIFNYWATICRKFTFAYWYW